ncbi:hypothetical protein CBR_g29875 [Chara braunii]|uniref:Pre-rRNA-processing protein RIX1 N-terminal domain-containing protein n=1 Tax=Chara braunii TaxID=69332 RepID=A0A388JWX7_CHABU|nr:hypothetical protein CBR_g29875 [Chara braunii]|eukprot:GBG62267.1 hypothetical protein CBR_g29875 [Chara braunii]
MRGGDDARSFQRVVVRREGLAGGGGTISGRRSDDGGGGWLIALHCSLLSGGCRGDKGCGGGAAAAVDVAGSFCACAIDRYALRSSFFDGGSGAALAMATDVAGSLGGAGGGGAGGLLGAQMNIFQRIVRIVRSYANALVQGGGDHGQRLALEKGDEMLAKEALKRRKDYDDSAKALKAQLDQQKVVVDKLISNTRLLETKIQEAKSRKGTLKARAQSAKTSQKVQQMVGSIDTSSALAAFEKMEEKVLALEFEAEAVAQIGTDDLATKFPLLEGDSVDDDLAAFKRDVVGGGAAKRPAERKWRKRKTRKDRGGEEKGRSRTKKTTIGRGKARGEDPEMFAEIERRMMEECDRRDKKIEEAELRTIAAVSRDVRNLRAEIRTEIQMMLAVNSKTPKRDRDVLASGLDTCMMEEEVLTDDGARIPPKRARGKRKAEGNGGRGKQEKIEEEKRKAEVEQRRQQLEEERREEKIRRWVVYAIKRRYKDLVITQVDRNGGDLVLMCPSSDQHGLDKMFTWSAAYDVVSRGEAETLKEMKRKFVSLDLHKLVNRNLKGKIGSPYVLPKHKDLERWRPIAPAYSEPTMTGRRWIARALNYLLEKLPGAKHFNLNATASLKQNLKKAEKKLHLFGGGQDEVLMSMHDVRFRSRLLQLLIQAHLPKDGKLPVTPQHLSSAVEMLTRHHLLAEPGTNGDLGSMRMGGPAVFTRNGTLDGCAGNGTTSRKLAVDAWADRLASLLASPVVENRAIGACLLGLTCKECLQSRFLECYSGWFSTLLTMLKSIESSFVRAAACAALSDLLARLGSLIDCPGVRRDGSALVSKLTVPLLQLLRDVQLRGIWLEGVDLICTVLKTFPLCLRSSFEKVEAVLVMILMNTGCKSSLRQRCAEGLALLPRAVGDSNTWSLLIRRVLVAVNSELDVAFAGLEDPGSAEVAMAELLPRQQEILPLGGPSVAAEVAAFADGETPFWRRFVPRVSALFHTLEYMLTNPYPSPVPMPLRPLLALIMRVLAVDGSRPVGMSSLGGQASLSQQASLCSELPVLHAGALNLLSATLRGARRQLLPVAGEIARLMSDCLRRSATLPDDKRSAAFTFKIHLYNVITEFLYATGAGGMVLSLAPVLVGIAVSDLRGPGRGGAGGGMMKSYSNDQYKGNQLLRQGPAGVSSPSRQAPLVGNTSASGVPSGQHGSVGVSTPQPNLQSGGGIGINGHHSQASASTMRKRKEPSGTVASDEQLPALVGASILFSEEGGGSTDSVMVAMYIAVLEVLEALLTVGGSMLPERWRAEVDAVIINVAMAVCHSAEISVDGGGGVGDAAEGALGGVKTVTHTLKIAACKALLASVLAPRCHRPPFLPQALSIFRRCRHEAGTELSQFCAHALLACEPLLHPRALPYPATTSPILSAPVGHGKGFVALSNNQAANKTYTTNLNRAASGNAAASDRWIDSQHHPGSGDPWADLDSWLGCADYASDMERAAFGLSGFDLMDINGAMMPTSDSLLGNAGGGNLETAAVFGYGGANQQGGSEVGMRDADQVGRGPAAMADSPSPVYTARLAATGESKDIIMPDVGTTSQRGCKSGELLMKTSTSYSTVPMAIVKGTSPGNNELMNRVTGGRGVDHAGAEPNLPTEKLGTGLRTSVTTGTAATSGGGHAGMRDLHGIMDVEPSAGGGAGGGGGGGSREVRDAYRTGLLDRPYMMGKGADKVEGCSTVRGGSGPVATASLPMRLGVDPDPGPCELNWSRGSSGSDKTPPLVSSSPSNTKLQVDEIGGVVSVGDGLVTSVSAWPHAAAVASDDASIPVVERTSPGSAEIPSAATRAPHTGTLSSKHSPQAEVSQPQLRAAYQEAVATGGTEHVLDDDSDGPLPDIVDGDPDENME